MPSEHNLRNQKDNTPDKGGRRPDYRRANKKKTNIERARREGPKQLTSKIQPNFLRYPCWKGAGATHVPPYRKINTIT